MILAISMALAAPHTVPYSARLTDQVGEPINGQVDLVVGIYDAPIGGEQQWSEPHPTTSVTQGYVTLELGQFVPFTSNVFAEPNRWLDIEVNEVSLVPRTPIQATAYALVGLGVAPLESEPVVCDALAVGRIYFDTTQGVVRACDGTAWISGAVAETGTPDNPAVSCLNVQQTNDGANTGLYWLDPEQDGSAFQAHCDMQRANGGWTLVGFLARENGQQNWAYGSSWWTDSTPRNAASLLSQPSSSSDSLDQKGPGYGSVAGTAFLFVCSPNYSVPSGQLLGEQSAEFGTMQAGSFSSMAGFMSATPSNTPFTVLRNTGSTANILVNKTSGQQGRISINDNVQWGEGGGDADGSCSVQFFVR